MDNETATVDPLVGRWIWMESRNPSAGHACGELIVNANGTASFSEFSELSIDPNQIPCGLPAPPSPQTLTWRRLGHQVAVLESHAPDGSVFVHNYIHLNDAQIVAFIMAFRNTNNEMLFGMKDTKGQGTLSFLKGILGV